MLVCAKKDAYMTLILRNVKNIRVSAGAAIARKVSAAFLTGLKNRDENLVTTVFH